MARCIICKKRIQKEDWIEIKRYDSLRFLKKKRIFCSMKCTKIWAHKYIDNLSALALTEFYINKGEYNG